MFGAREQVTDRKTHFSSVVKTRRVNCSFKYRNTLICNVKARWHVPMSTFWMSLFYLRFEMVWALKHLFKVCKATFLVDLVEKTLHFRSRSAIKPVTWFIII